jgi:hypothetical protein
MQVALQQPRLALIFATLSKPFTAIGACFDALANANIAAQQVQDVLKMTDEDFAAKGLTRDQAIRQIFDL